MIFVVFSISIFFCWMIISPSLGVQVWVSTGKRHVGLHYPLFKYTISVFGYMILFSHPLYAKLRFLAIINHVSPLAFCQKQKANVDPCLVFICPLPPPSPTHTQHGMKLLLMFQQWTGAGLQPCLTLFQFEEMILQFFWELIEDR